MEKHLAITSDENYREIMIVVYELMNKGAADLSDEKLEELKIMTLAVEKYEDEELNLNKLN